MTQEFRAPLVSVGERYHLRLGFKCKCGHEQPLNGAINNLRRIFCQKCYRSYVVTHKKLCQTELIWSGWWHCPIGNHLARTQPMSIGDVKTCAAHVKKYVKSLKNKKDECEKKIKRIDERIAHALAHQL